MCPMRIFRHRTLLTALLALVAALVADTAFSGCEAFVFIHTGGGDPEIGAQLARIMHGGLADVV